MKFYIESRENPGSLQVRRVLRDVLIGKGHELVLNKAQADKIFVEVKKENTLPLKCDNKLVFYKAINGRPKIIQLTNTNKSNRKLLQEVPTKNMKLNYSKMDIENLSKGIIDYLLGRVDSVEVLDPFPYESIKDLLDLSLNHDRSSNSALSEVNKIKSKFTLNDVDVQVLSEEVRMASRLDTESRLIGIISSAEYAHTDYFGKGILIPNVSYSLISNVIKAYTYLNYSEIAKTQEKKENNFKKALKEIDELKKSIKNSLFGKNCWKQYGKSELGGLYGLFIPDNSLKDDEIRIPKPTFGNFKSVIGGVEVAILKKHKIILATSENQEILKLKRRMRYRLKIVDSLDDTLSSLRLYPKIGDKIVVTRHPITTLMIEVTVVGYTEDASIRINNKLIQIEEGDADGDSLSVAWGHPADIKFADQKQLNEYIKIANIELNISPRDNNYKIDNSIKEIDLDKQNKSAEEQATAKLATANMTGSFGVAERTFILSCILSGIKVDLEMVYSRSRMSQLSVQAKNILADLQKGKLSEQIIETFKTYYIVMGCSLDALNTLAAFLDVSVERVKEILGLSEMLEEIAESKTLVELF